MLAAPLATRWLPWLGRTAGKTSLVATQERNGDRGALWPWLRDDGLVGAAGYYLDPGEAVGCPYCFDPASTPLCAALRAPVPERVDAAALAGDLEWFRELLEVGCAGYSRLAASPGFDAEEFFGHWSARLRATAQQVRTREAIVEPMAQLQRLAPSSHLLLAGVGMNTPPARRRADADSPYAWAAVSDTAVITLTTFQGFRGDVGSRLERFVADYSRHAAHDRILFDLRGNGGGRLDYMLRWIAQARSSDWQTYPYEEVLGLLAPCTRWNQTVGWQVRNDTVDSAEAARERVRLQSEWPEPATAPATRVFDGWREGNGEHPYRGRVYVAVDRHTGSSGERAAIDLQRALGAVLIGEPTAGAVQYTEGVPFVLPATGLRCTIPTKRHDFGREIEGTGWPVDIPLDDIEQDSECLVDLLDGVER